MDDPSDDPLAFRKKLEGARTLDLSGIVAVQEMSPSGSEYEMPEKVKTIDLEKVRNRMKVQGYDLPEPEAPDPDVVRKTLKRSDPTADYRRNRAGYRVMCPVCLDRKKCTVCKGRKRVKLIFKCKTCMGTGICQDCDRENEVTCPQCKGWISQYADTCRKCGLSFRCPSCGASLPAMATRCISCGTEMRCGDCKKPYPRQYSWKCPHCGHWNERA